MANCKDLATKAELQELRSQLNSVIGRKEDGGVVEVFQAGNGEVVTPATMALTAYVFAQTRAVRALINIATTSALEAPIWKDLKNGAAKWIGTRGNGAQQPITALNQVSKTAGNNAKAASLAAKGGRLGGGGLGVLVNLVNLGATLALNKVTVDILDKRIEAEARGAQLQIDAVNSSMLRLYDKQQGDIDAVVAELDSNKAITEQNQQQLGTARFDIANAQRVNNDLIAEIDRANLSITDLQTANQELVSEIESANLENKEAFDNLKTQAQEIEAQLIEAVEIINKQKETITKQGEKIEQLETRVTDLEVQIERLDLQYILLREEFIQLREEILGDPEATEARAKLERALLIVGQNQSFTSGGGASGAALGGAAQGQNAILDLTAKLSGTNVDTPEITNTSIVNNPTLFDNSFNDLLTQLQSTTDVNQEQIDGLRDNLKVDFKNELNSAIGSLLIPGLVQLKDQTSQRRLADAAVAGICESLNGGGSCPATPSNPNPTQGLKGLKDILAAKADQISAALGLVNLGANQSILGIVQNTNNVVNSTTHGLAKIQSFAETAWKVTKADKVMAGVSMAMTIHNGMMLSNNLLSTVSEALNMSLNALNIRDETDTPIDIGAAIRSKIQSILTNLLGADQYAALTTRIAKANRIYQTGINVLDTTYSLFDSARSVAELTAENTGKIGNALRESGAVYEDTYEEFLEKVNPQNASLRRLDKFREGLEGVENVFSTISQVSSDVVEFQENVEQLKTEKEELAAEINEVIAAEIELKQQEKLEATAVEDVREDAFDSSQEVNLRQAE